MSSKLLPYVLPLRSALLVVISDSLDRSIRRQPPSTPYSDDSDEQEEADANTDPRDIDIDLEGGDEADGADGAENGSNDFEDEDEDYSDSSILLDIVWDQY
ncbi:hypothetical protein B0J14DRAFT_658685 [Halenospora varia]|nr:hypothetical protein B0J14DRAFT_658685 [Halenospora varia]